MAILVTGGSGFIGSHLVDKLVEKGYSVRVFDKLKPRREDVEWLKGDLQNEREILQACRDVEVIYHLAAVADVNVALSNPELCLQVNEVGTADVLKAATASEVDRVVLASTTWVYGRVEGVVDETSPIPPPDHIYTKTKIGQEHLLIAWHKHYGLAYTILRYGIPYGPRMRSNMAIAIFVRKAMRKEPITIFGDGMQGRCFIYVDDLAEGSIASLKQGGKNQVFNIAGAEFVTINQIARNLKRIFGETAMVHENLRPGDFRGVKVRIEKAKKMLAWEPRVSFEIGLKKYVEYVRSNPQQLSPDVSKTR
ncbi:MAG: NAD-dependent epimerase/dehydratase family protein [Promethearchaeota archaeon]